MPTKRRSSPQFSSESLEVRTLLAANIIAVQEPNNTIETAQPISIGETNSIELRDRIGQGDIDFFRLSLEVGQNVSLKVQSDNSLILTYGTLVTYSATEASEVNSTTDTDGMQTSDNQIDINLTDSSASLYSSASSMASTGGTSATTSSESNVTVKRVYGTNNEYLVTFLAGLAWNWQRTLDPDGPYSLGASRVNTWAGANLHFTSNGAPGDITLITNSTTESYNTIEFETDFSSDSSTRISLSSRYDDLAGYYLYPGVSSHSGSSNPTIELHIKQYPISPIVGLFDPDGHLVKVAGTGETLDYITNVSGDWTIGISVEGDRDFDATGGSSTVGRYILKADTTPVILPDIIVDGVTFDLVRGGAQVNYHVSGPITATEVPIALTWGISGPSAVKTEFATQLRADLTKNSTYIPANMLLPPSIGGSARLAVVIDPFSENQVVEVDEIENNRVLSEIVPNLEPSSWLQIVATTEDGLGTRPEMGFDYDIHIIVRNDSPVPILVGPFQWRELDASVPIELSMQSGEVSQVALEFGSGEKTIRLGTFRHVWDWIGSSQETANYVQELFDLLPEHGVRHIIGGAGQSRLDAFLIKYRLAVTGIDIALRVALPDRIITVPFLVQFKSSGPPNDLALYENIRIKVPDSLQLLHLQAVSQFAAAKFFADQATSMLSKFGERNARSSLGLGLMALRLSTELYQSAHENLLIARGPWAISPPDSGAQGLRKDTRQNSTHSEQTQYKRSEEVSVQFNSHDDAGIDHFNHSNGKNRSLPFKNESIEDFFAGFTDEDEAMLLCPSQFSV